MKRFFSLLLVLALVLGCLPAVALKAEAATLTLAELRQKFPHGKYWNHVDKPGSSYNNQDGYSDQPCPRHGNIGSSTQTCNGFAPHGRQQSWQCMGFAEKLGYDATGESPRDSGSGWVQYNSSSALDKLKPGDIVRYDNHSIYVTAVDGDTVTFADCNYYAKCQIRWDGTISMAKLRSSFVYLQSAPTGQKPEETVWQEDYAGTYRCTTETSYLNIRSGSGTGYSILGSIPPGGLVQVSAATGEGAGYWAKVTYNGISGYASMEYLEKYVPKPDICAVSMSLGNDLSLYFFVEKAAVSGGDYYMQITKTYADARDNDVRVVPKADWLSYGDYYMAQFDGIAAKEMTDALYAVVYTAEGVQAGSVKATSVEEYALRQLEDSSDAALKTVLADMLLYGAQAQKTFGYNLENLATDAMTEAQKSFATASLDMSALGAVIEKGTGWAGASLSLESSIVLNVFYNSGVITEDMKATVRYESHGGTAVQYEIPGSAFVTYNEACLFLHVDTLAAADLQTPVTVEIFDGENLVSKSICNMAAYCAANDQNAMCIALAKYCKSAYLYFHQ